MVSKIESKFCYYGHPGFKKTSLKNLSKTIQISASEQGITERKSVVESTHDISVVNTHIHFTESELQLGKVGIQKRFFREFFS